MTEKGSRIKLLSMAVAALFMLTALGTLTSSMNDAAEYNSGETYYINMFEGEGYSYIPGVNITTVGVTTFTVTDPNGIPGLAIGSGTSNMRLSFTAPSEEITYQPIKVTAKWMLTDDESISQEIYQNIVFKTYLKPYFMSHIGAHNMSTYSVASDVSAGTTIDTLSIIGTGASVVGISLKDSNGDDAEGITATLDEGGRVVTLSVESQLIAGERYTLIIDGNATVGSDDSNECIASIDVRFTADIVVVDDSEASITAEHFYTYAGEDDDPIEAGTYTYRHISYHPVGMDDATLSVENSSNTGVLSNGTIGSEGIRIDTSAIEFTDGYRQDINFKVRLLGTLNGDEVDIVQDFTLTIFASEYFSSEPRLSNLTVNHTGDDLKDAVASAIASGAIYAVYSWGDGTPDTRVDFNSPNGGIPPANHRYSSSSLYHVKVTVYNDYGSASLSVGYSTITGSLTNDPLAKVIVKQMEIDGVNYIQLDATNSVNATHYRWYKGADSTDVLGQDDTFNIRKSDWKATDVYVLVVENDYGDTNRYVVDFSDGERPQGNQEEKTYDVIDWILMIVGITLFILAVIVYTYYGIRIPQTVLVMFAGAVMAAIGWLNIL